MTITDDEIRQEAAKHVYEYKQNPNVSLYDIAEKCIKRGIDLVIKKPNYSNLLSYDAGLKDVHAERDKELMELVKRYSAQGNSLNYGSTVVIELKKLIRTK